MSLVALLLIPVLGALACFVVKERSVRGFAGLVALVDFGLALWLMGQKASGFSVPWMPSLGINFALAVDGLSILLLILAPLLTTLAVVLTPADFPRLSEYCGLVLLLLASLQGLFLADNLGLFYIFFEVMLLPTLVLAARWGGEKGHAAALKFFLFTLAGSLPMLLAVLYLAFSRVHPNLDFSALTGIGDAVQWRLLLLFALAFAVKIPLVPFHGWLPDLYRNLPAQVAAVVAGVMSKAGIYGFLRIGLGLFPHAMHRLAPYLTILAVISLLYGAISALGSKTMRDVLSYSSLSHLGMIGLGAFALDSAGVSGSVLQMLSHGVATGGLFLVLGMLEYRRVPAELEKVGGLAQQAPRLAALFMFLAMASLGLPGLCSFPGELMILTGTYHVNPGLAVLATLGIIFAAWYTLRLFGGAMHGPPVSLPQFADLGLTEVNGLVPLAILAVLIGIAPSIWLGPVEHWVHLVKVVM